MFRKKPSIIMPFGGYANESKLFATARVLKDKNIRPKDHDHWLKNLYLSYKRFESDEIPGAQVRIRWQDQTYTTVSDHEGYVHVELTHHLAPDVLKQKKISITYELLQGEVIEYSITDSVLLPASGSTFGIISDLDDTVLNTGVSSFLKWRVLVNSLIRHSKSRKPLEGVQKFYQMLKAGKQGNADNPFFYLSNSPWNLFDYLETFLEHQQLPEGVLLLRDIGFEHRKKKSFLHKNKFQKIDHILRTYPDMKFILLGDAADIDPAIYLEVARQFPEQVLRIYIRTVNHTKKMKRARTIINEQKQTEVILFETTEQAAEDARQKGFISS
ncbi:App1 family protein [Flavobacteriaceae bacterium M23B6Z8]